MKHLFFMLGLFVGVVAVASTVSELPWQDDTDLKSLFSGGKATHAVCISKGRGSLRVAGLSFEQTTDRNAWEGNPDLGSYRLWNLDQLFGGKKPAATQVAGTGAGLLDQFFYTQKGQAVRLELGGLVPSKSYRLIVFTQGWDANPNVRVQLVSSSTDSVEEVVGSKMKVVEPNRFGPRAGNLVVVDYVADRLGHFKISFDPLDDPMSLHLAAFANFERN